MSNQEHPFTNFELLQSNGLYCHVYRAQRYNQWWVLKTLKPEYKGNQSWRNALFKEYQIGKELDSQSIVKYVGWEYVPKFDDYCIVEEYIQGITLKEYLATHHFMMGISHKIIKEILEALIYCTGQQVVHRDLKPSNIMVTNNGKNIKLIDFGLSDRDDFAILKMPAGSRNYMAPEQGVKGAKVDFRADMYALGKIMIDFKAPRRFSYIIERCTQEDPDKRYPSYEALRKDLLDTMHRYRLRVRTILSLVLFAIFGVMAFVLGYGALGGMVLGFEGEKQVFASIPDVYYEDADSYEGDERFSSFFMPKHNSNIYYLRQYTDIPGPIDESKAVDLGLSVKWAPFNLGCERESLHLLGALVGYGDTTGHIASNEVERYPKGNITPDKDIVRLHWGGKWRMPTSDEVLELLNKCQWRVVIENGHQPGFVVTGPNGNSIVMAGTGLRYLGKHYEALRCGYFWTSTYGTKSDGGKAVCLSIDRDNFKLIEADVYYGMAIRPVLPYEKKRAKRSERLSTERLH